MKLFRIILLASLLLLGSGGRVSAQWKFCSWSALDVSHKFCGGKLTAGLYSEYRTQEQEETLLGFGQFYLRPKLTYTPARWVALTMQADFAFYPEKERKIRYIPQVKFNTRLGPAALSWRQRLMVTTAGGRTESVLNRSMLSAAYAPAGARLSPYIAAEPFYAFRKEGFLNRVRWYAGLRYSFSRSLSCSFQYVFQDYYKAGKTDDHILFLIMNVSL